TPASRSPRTALAPIIARACIARSYACAGGTARRTCCCTCGRGKRAEGQPARSSASPRLTTTRDGRVCITASFLGLRCHHGPPWQGVFLRERDPRPMEAIGRPPEALEDVIEATIELLPRMQQEEPPIGGRPGAVFDRLVSLDNEPGP